MGHIHEPANAVISATEGATSTEKDAGPICVNRTLLIVLVFLVAAIAVAHQAEDAHFDFGVFYYGAHMVLDGARHSLYDVPTQHLFQLRFHRPLALMFCHPPFATIPFLPIAKLPIEAAFIAWTAISLTLLVFCVQVLAQYAGLRCGNWPILLCIAFMPVASCLGHGQLSFLILSGYVLAYSLWRKERFFLGGLALSIVDIKFQLVVGFVAVLLLKRKWRELAGFASGSAVLIAISALITGIPGLLRYPAFLLSGMGDSGAKPTEMACWRGLMSIIGADHVLVVAVVSAVTILFAAGLWREDLDRGFTAALIAAMLVSYHFNVSDLSLFLIPAFLAVRLGFPKARLLRLVLSGLLIPEILAALGSYYALLAMPLALCLWWISRQQHLNSSTEIATAAVIQ